VPRIGTKAHKDLVFSAQTESWEDRIIEDGKAAAVLPLSRFFA